MSCILIYWSRSSKTAMEKHKTGSASFKKKGKNKSSSGPLSIIGSSLPCNVPGEMTGLLPSSAPLAGTDPQFSTPGESAEARRRPFAAPGRISNPKQTLEKSRQQIRTSFKRFTSLRYCRSYVCWEFPGSLEHPPSAYLKFSHPIKLKVHISQTRFIISIHLLHKFFFSNKR